MLIEDTDNNEDIVYLFLFVVGWEMAELLISPLLILVTPSPSLHLFCGIQMLIWRLQLVESTVTNRHRVYVRMYEMAIEH